MSLKAFIYHSSPSGAIFFLIGFGEMWMDFPEYPILRERGEEKYPMYTFFDLLGGKKEDGESDEECILREIKEESNFTILSPIVEDKKGQYFKIRVEREDYFSSILNFNLKRKETLLSLKEGEPLSLSEEEGKPLSLRKEGESSLELSALMWLSSSHFNDLLKEEERKIFSSLFE